MVDGRSLYEIHDALCHPGITRTFVFIRCKNLPFSVEDVRKVVNNCSICLERKPKFHVPPAASLIKAMQPFEQLNLDFEGPVPSNSKNKFFLTIVDEYSRFPFVFPCPDTSATTVSKCLTQLFVLFGIHSDSGSAFLSDELRSFLTKNGINSSFITPYNPRGNGQMERYNGIVWKAISLAVKSQNLKIEQLEQVLPVVLHSLRSLCTATNTTPHERLFSFSRKSSWSLCTNVLVVSRSSTPSKTCQTINI